MRGGALGAIDVLHQNSWVEDNLFMGAHTRWPRRDMAGTKPASDAARDGLLEVGLAALPTARRTDTAAQTIRYGLKRPMFQSKYMISLCQALC